MSISPHRTTDLHSCSKHESTATVYQLQAICFEIDKILQLREFRCCRSWYEIFKGIMKRLLIRLIFTTLFIFIMVFIATVSFKTQESLIRNLVRKIVMFTKNMFFSYKIFKTIICLDTQSYLHF